VFLEKENLISHWKGDDLVAGLKGKEAGNQRRGLGRQKCVSGAEN
jgi:hypothetical protein